ncbi:MAG: hypothetical protein LBK99_21850 [Opitutaceae bacterium]|jgi:hypothetical protein|nr:hypothetical protein [Opitutaceae bacterium]
MMKTTVFFRCLLCWVLAGALGMAELAAESSGPQPEPEQGRDRDRAPAPAGEEACGRPGDATFSGKAGKAAEEAWNAAKKKSREFYEDAKVAARGGVAWLDETTFDARTAAAAKLDRLADKAGEKIADWKAGAKELTPEMKAKLDKALADFRESVRELGKAGASGWSAAKTKVTESWEKLRKAFGEAEGGSGGESGKQGKPEKESDANAGNVGAEPGKGGGKAPSRPAGDEKPPVEWI